MFQYFFQEEIVKGSIKYYCKYLESGKCIVASIRFHKGLFRLNISLRRKKRPMIERNLFRFTDEDLSSVEKELVNWFHREKLKLLFVK